MSIFQSIVVLRHFVSLFVHRYILGHTPFSESTRPFSRLSFTFWSSCWPLWVAYWGIPSVPRIIRPFTGFIIFWLRCRSSWVVILEHIPSCQVCLHHYLSYLLALSRLIRSPSYQFSLSQDCTYIDQSSSCQFEFVFWGPHPYRSAIFLLVSV